MGKQDRGWIEKTGLIEMKPDGKWPPGGGTSGVRIGSLQKNLLNGMARCSGWGMTYHFGTLGALAYPREDRNQGGLRKA
jgi:hypothetical protein